MEEDLNLKIKELEQNNTNLAFLGNQLEINQIVINSLVIILEKLNIIEDKLNKLNLINTPELPNNEKS